MRRSQDERIAYFSISQALIEAEIVYQLDPLDKGGRHNMYMGTFP
jgi:hypothetical protein